MTTETKECTCSFAWIDANTFVVDRVSGEWHRKGNHEMCGCCGRICPVPMTHTHVTRFSDVVALR